MASDGQALKVTRMCVHAERAVLSLGERNREEQPAMVGGYNRQALLEMLDRMDD